MCFCNLQFEKMETKAAHLEWYNAPLSYQKNMNFFLLHSLKPVTFTAYKVSPVNLESFFAVSIINNKKYNNSMKYFLFYFRFARHLYRIILYYEVLLKI